MLLQATSDKRGDGISRKRELNVLKLPLARAHQHRFFRLDARVIPLLSTPFLVPLPLDSPPCLPQFPLAPTPSRRLLGETILDDPQIPPPPWTMTEV